MLFYCLAHGGMLCHGLAVYYSMAWHAVTLCGMMYMAWYAVSFCATPWLGILCYVVGWRTMLFCGLVVLFNRLAWRVVAWLVLACCAMMWLDGVVLWRGLAQCGVACYAIAFRVPL